MKRRDFLWAVAGAVAWPTVAMAQQETLQLIGFLSSRSPEESKPHLAGFLRGLEAFGYIDGKTLRSNIVALKDTMINSENWPENWSL